MSSRSRERSFGTLSDGVEQLLELLKGILSEAIRRTKPGAHHDGLLDPDLVLFPEESNVDQIIEDLAGSGVAVKL